ncbi:uncharacterized protein EV420DRAFT_1640321 [Desarmillaria tabescens]|uniref:Uncharacterized protein n=1 Tax=Armillaria tabescens TaxID=1929756 RepID=A0AA39TX28_ARMTA|nr:uncharacterized protein EV420DRAFT_1640321 [Desarmillaria tabescens]KAK0462030.1 hypothetical protein EV420DRAFT_1640321 [Desarmillaria tabescens]
MTKATILLLSLYFPLFILAKEISKRSLPSEGYYSPADNGGSMLTVVGQTYPDGQQEPVNAIISGNSDQAVLAQQSTNGGLINYFLSLSFSGECLGQHTGNSQQVNLGDGNGFRNETAVMRYNYGDPALGSCTESVKGGDHFRYWVQNGSEANSGAAFLAISYETSSSDNHDIVENGYNLGRDYVVGNITGSNVSTLALTGSSTFSGTSSSQGYTYKTDIMYATGLLQNTSIGINHNQSVSNNGAVNAVDGLVAVFSVSITGKPSSDSSSNSSGSSNLAWPEMSKTWSNLLALFLISFMAL